MKGETGHYYCGQAVLGCPCCDGICGPNHGCNCLPCQALDLAGNKSSPTLPSSQATISSWTWAEQPPRAALASVLAAIVREQGELVGSAAGTTLSSMRLRQRLTVTQRYLTALGRTAQPAQQQERLVPVVAVVEEREDRRPPGERAAMGLARVGSRAALSFAFAFLRRAWRSGEDQDLCSDLLSESLEALQALPEASLFDSKAVSAVWLEVVELN